jgi:transposase
LFDLLLKTVKSGNVIQMDETTVQVVNEEGRNFDQKSYMWLARGGPPGQKVIWYEYHPTRKAQNAKEFLEGYSGYLQTDGYKGYDTAVEGRMDIIHAGCFAHARRKFFEAAKINKESLSANEGVSRIRKLYELENKLRDILERDKNIEKFLAERRKQAEPILSKFKDWLLNRQKNALPSSLLGKAIHYTLDQWPKLIAYLESPDLTPDNNACENAIRPFVLGRKNWLFCQSANGAKSSCGIYTLIETAKQNGFIPFEYLMALFGKAPLAVSAEDWEKLLPWNIFNP